MPYFSSVWGGYILMEVRQELSTANPIFRDRLSFRAAGPPPGGGGPPPAPNVPLPIQKLSISHERRRAL
jgi:hypothetical protein